LASVAVPVGQAEAFGEQFAADHRVFAGEHAGQAVAGLLGEGAGDRCRRVAEHGAGVAEAEVDVLVAVDIEEAGALSALDEQRGGRRPVAHPVHRHAAEQRMSGALGQRQRARVALEEALPLARGQNLYRLFRDAAGCHVEHLVRFFAHPRG